MSDTPTAPMPPTVTRKLARSRKIPLSELLGPQYVRVYHDTYFPSAMRLTVGRRARLAMTIVKGASHVSHHTAVQLWGGVPPASASIHLSMTSSNARSRRAGIPSHVTSTDTKVTTHHGLPVSTPEQAFLDLASVGVELVDLVIARDSLVKATGVDPKRFVVAAATSTGNGAVRARRAAALVRTGVDSPMETRLRLLIVLAGLPEPVVNFKIRNEHGEVIWRFDLSFPLLKLVIEYDGRQHADDDAQWAGDIERREAVEGLGWRFLIVQQAGIYRDPERTLHRVRGAMIDRGAARGRSGSSQPGEDTSRGVSDSEAQPYGASTDQMWSCGRKRPTNPPDRLPDVELWAKTT